MHPHLLLTSVTSASGTFIPARDFESIVDVLRAEGSVGVVLRRIARLLATREVAKLVFVHILRVMLGAHLKLWSLVESCP